MSCRNAFPSSPQSRCFCVCEYTSRHPDDLVKETSSSSRHLRVTEDESKYTFPTIKYATQLYDSRAENCFKLGQLEITRRSVAQRGAANQGITYEASSDS